jgi:hypothetical protein
MTISTLQHKRKALPTPLVYILGIVGIGLIVYFGGEILRNLGNLKGKSSINVETPFGTADVYINGALVGKSTYKSQEIVPGENTIEIKEGDRQYQTSLTFLPHNNKYMHHVGITRDLGVSEHFSAGNEFWFEKDTSENILRIISEPTDATVFIDETDVGKTPFVVNNLTEGDYDLRVEIPGYESQEARINVKQSYTLNISLKLFPAPVPAKVSAFENSPSVYDLATDDEVTLADTKTWSKAVIHWNKTRGINLAGIGVSKERLFGYYIDYRGTLYDGEGNLVDNIEEFAPNIKDAKGAYLGRKSDEEGLTKEAAATLETLMGVKVATGGKTATILPTGQGWLRIRSAPGLSGAEVTKVDVGNTYDVLEEGAGWVKIQVDADTVGWAYAQYVELSE